jgi:hypothetical protein
VENDWVNDSIIKFKRPGVVRINVMWVLVTILCCLNGCTGKTTVIYIPQEENTRPVSQLEEMEDVTEALKEYYISWQGTRYIYGGLSRNGVDCSGLTLLTYKELFGQDLPRTVKEQVKEGVRISQGSLQPGDLVFFKTGRFQKHVGIYLEDDLFIHASRSKGVTISSLQNLYWQKRFWQAQRLQPEADLEMLALGTREQTVVADY